MSIGTTAALVAGGLGAAGAIGGSLISSNAAGNAENTQATEAANSLAEQQREFNIEQQNEQPWLQAGEGALSQLSSGLAPGGSLVQPYTGTYNPGTFTPPSPFTAPTGLTEQNDPGFQARLALGQQALEATDAAQGITGGGSEKAAEQYGQTFATNDYQNVYNNALNAYNTNYGTSLNSYLANAQTGLSAFNTNYGVFENNQANQFNRLASLAGAGQTAVAGLNQAGQNAANSIVGINTNLANQTSNLQTQQGNVLTAGLGGAAGAITGATNNYAQYQLLQQVLNNQQNSSGYGPQNTPYYPPAPYPDPGNP